MKRLSCAFALALVAALAPTLRADESQTMFPFVVEQGAVDNITDVRTWNADARVAGADGYVTAREGKFETASGRARMLGTNLCFGANFPSKEKAERLADSLARFGIGIVRLHHMDSRDIWGKNIAKSTTEIDPEQLDKLDYLIACLHKRGIYVDINLHVSRAFRDLDGFENAAMLPSQNKGVDNFDRRMIELQKKYAKDLLTHVNSYLGKAYVDDPGVAVIEINNENSVVASWSWGELDDLPSPYADELRALWNAWLVKKYETNAKLRDAWKCETVPLQEDQIGDAFDANFKFNSGNEWTLELDDEAKCERRGLDAADAGLDVGALSVKIEKMGQVAWRPQFSRVGLKIRKNKPYRTTFKYRSANESSFNVGIVENHDPWGTVGFRKTVKASKEWQTFDASFVATVDDSSVRMTFGGFQEGVEFEIADVSFQEGGTIGIDDAQTVEAGAVPVPKKNGDDVMFSREALDDFAEFLHDIENDYWQEMFDYVKGLGAKQLATGTQLQYGYWHNQARLDYCDIHAYWNHPNFPRRQWDQSDWLITNTCLANSPVEGTLSNLAAVRVLGRPFTCSEYDHPYPNSYCAEGNLMLAAVAAFQDWSAIFQFAWSHGDNFERQTVDPFFDMCSQQTKLAHLPACWAIFARGDVKAGPGEFVYAPEMTEEKELDVMRGSLSEYHRPLARALGLDKSLALAVYSGLDLSDLNLSKGEAFARAKKISAWNDLPDRMGSRDEKRITNEFGEICWDFRKPGKGTFVVDAANSKVFSGFVSEPIEFDGVRMNVGETMLGWTTISLVKGTNASPRATKNGKLTPGRWLLAATGDMRNDGAIVKKVGDRDVTTAAHFGGANGHAPVLCEGIPAAIVLNNLDLERVDVYALDPSGARGVAIPTIAVDEGVKFEIDPKYKTLWYEIVVR